MISQRDKRDDVPLNCEQVRDLFSPMIETPGPSEVRERVDRHLESCPGCSAEWQQFRLAVGAVQTLPRHPVPRSFAADVMGALPQAVTVEAEPSRPALTRGWRGPLRWVALVLFAVLLAVLYVEYRLESRGTDQMAARAREQEQFESMRKEVLTAFDETTRGLEEERRVLREGREALAASLAGFAGQLESIRTADNERHAKLARSIEDLDTKIDEDLDDLHRKTRNRLDAIDREQVNIASSLALLEERGPADTSVVDVPSVRVNAQLRNASSESSGRLRQSLSKVRGEESTEYRFDLAFETDADYEDAFRRFRETTGQDQAVVYDEIVRHFSRDAAAVQFVDQGVRRVLSAGDDQMFWASFTSQELSKETVDQRSLRIGLFEDYYYAHYRNEPEDGGRAL